MDQPCKSGKDTCVPFCFADCYPCNAEGDCDTLVAFGVLADKGDTKCWSLENSTASGRQALGRTLFRKLIDEHKLGDGSGCEKKLDSVCGKEWKTDKQLCESCVHDHLKDLEPNCTVIHKEMQRQPYETCMDYMIFLFDFYFRHRI